MVARARRLLLGCVAALVAALLGAPAADAGTAVGALRTGQQLLPGGRIESPDRFVRLYLQGDGNLVLVAGGLVLWSTRTSGHPGDRLVLQSDGNLVLRARSGAAVWASGTRGSGASDVLRVTDDGTALLTDAARHRLWATPTRAGALAGGSELGPGQFLSGPGSVLVMQTDGNLVLYRGRTALWNTRTWGHPGARAQMQGDGNLVVRGPDGRALWMSGTRGLSRPLLVVRPGAVAVVTGARVAWQAPGPVATTGAQLAARLLALWGPRFSGLPGVLSDLRTVAAGRTLTSADSCGHPVTIDPRLLAVLIAVTSRYDLVLNNIVTGHGCDSALHPKGQATDIGRVTDPRTGSATTFHGDNPALVSAFLRYLGGLLPAGAGLGQLGCAGNDVTPPAGIAHFADSCTHQHLQVGRDLH